ncbi:pyridoxine 4-dehydrogenase [Bradyrhizobium sp. USDA 4516]
MIHSTITIGDDLTVNRLGFGAMRVTTGTNIWSYPPDRKNAIAFLRHVVERGVNLIDTADSYGPESCETLIAEALHPYPANLVIATKGGLVHPAPEIWEADCRPDRLRAACEGSLKRLRLDRIDLYQLHVIDPKVPLSDSLGALVDLQCEGKIRHIGISNFNPTQLAAAQRHARIASVQNCYNIADREHEPVIEACARAGIAFLPYRPLRRGALPNLSGQLGAIAQRLGVTPAQVALAWLLCRTPWMLPIPATTSLGHFDENMGAARITLSDAEFTALGQYAKA